MNISAKALREKLEKVLECGDEEAFTALNMILDGLIRKVSPPSEVPAGKDQECKKSCQAGPGIPL